MEAKCTIKNRLHNVLYAFIFDLDTFKMKVGVFQIVQEALRFKQVEISFLINLLFMYGVADTNADNEQGTH